jgi:RimJ/RimL family protein N-acetyltransferase
MLYGETTCLRPVEERDIDCYLAWINEPELARVVLGSTVPLSRVEILEKFKACSGHLDNNLFFTINLLSQRETIGFCILKGIHPIHRFAELEQFFIAEEKYRRHGYGRESLRIIMRHSFSGLNLNRLWLITYAYNHSAINFYEREGFVREGVLRQIQFTMGRYHDGIIMGILKEDWEVKNQNHNQQDGGSKEKLHS